MNNNHKSFDLLRGLFIAGFSLVAACTQSPLGYAAEGAQTADAPTAGISYASYASPKQQMAARDALLSRPAGTVEWTARIAYTDGEIYNPATGKMDKVRLRSYQGEGVDPDVPFVPPAINLRPGDTFLFNLENDLPTDDPSCVDHGDVNIPHCFNSTNMHVHGLWVSPSGNSDNVLLRLTPGATFTHEYNIPADHPAGTFWYHPHLHGATALQVSSGMGGPLIIRGERLPGADDTGDIDTLLRYPDGAPLGERIVTLTQIAYACGKRDETGMIDIKTDDEGFWVCDDDDVGMVEGYNQFGMYENFDTPSGIPDVRTRWQVSGRHTALNGRVMPTIDGVKTGEIERWRFIQAGVSGSISVSFRKFEGDFSDYDGGDSVERDSFVGDRCTGDEVDQFSIALDGLTRSRVNMQQRTMLHPGYRDDVLIAFPEPGLYCMIDNDAPKNENIRMQEKQRQLLGFVRVSGDARSNTSVSAKETVQNFMVAAAEAHMPESVRGRVTGELSGAVIDLASFVAHESLIEAELDGTQTLGFDTFVNEEAPHLPGGAQNDFVVGTLDLESGPLPKLINASEYEMGRMDRSLILGNVEEWTLAAFTEGHPFHKHVNPVQIVSIIDPDTGIDVSAFESGSVYAGLKGQWKDTVFLPTNLFGAPYTVTVRTQYKRYIGTFVLHCHILDHEDFGMMQVLEVVMPPDPNAMSHGATHHSEEH
ncbi:MAG: multicopper oxidase domain-containing protein [Pseudomonadota bacterium]